MTLEFMRCFTTARLRRFGRDERGVSAVEFAMLLPLMVTLYLGGVEISQAVSADRKTTLVAHTLADLVAQAKDVKTSDLTNILNASAAVLYPFSSANVTTTVSSVCIDATGAIATVAWSSNPALRSGVVTSLINGGLMGAANANTSLIWGEATYAFKPTIGWTITGTLKLGDKMLLRPRLQKSVTFNSANACP
jgi:Flp pilus assembly protein TadG